MSVSEQRFASIRIGKSNEVVYTLRGAAGEKVTLLFLEQATGRMLQSTCTFPPAAGNTATTATATVRRTNAVHMAVSVGGDGVCRSSEA